MLWSILIAAIPERYHTVQPLLHSLLEQQNVARMPDVELLYVMDNKRRPVGAKRNVLLSMARGEYISFVDDDDTVAADYVEKVYRKIVEGRKLKDVPDVICFPQRATLVRQGVIHECTYGLGFFRDRKPEERRKLESAVDATGTSIPNTLVWTGPPAHTMVWRRALASTETFEEKTFGEDTAWVDALCAKAKHEARIDGQPLYFYNFDSEATATR